MCANDKVFTKNRDGRIVRRESVINIFPERENSLKIMFGGDILKIMDELSGTLATNFLAVNGMQAVHTSQFTSYPGFMRSGESGQVIAEVVLSTDKIICVYVSVLGGNAQEPDAYTKRYEGFGLCAVIDTATGTMVKNLTPYVNPDVSPQLLGLAQRVIDQHREMRKALKAIL